MNNNKVSDLFGQYEYWGACQGGSACRRGGVPGDRARGTVPGGPCQGDRAGGTVPGGPCRGDRAGGTLPGGPCRGDRAGETVPGGTEMRGPG